MNDLAFFLSLAWRDRWRLRLGAALAAATLLAGIGLMATAGWFVAAAALAGAAGAGAAFNHLFASGGVRAFALTRTAGRYAERLVTHEATFRILSRLRLWVFDTVAPLAPGAVGRLRSGDLLSRVIQDVDTLDNLYLRLVTPVAAALAGAFVTAGLLALTAPAALPGVIGLFALAGFVLPWLAARSGSKPGTTMAEAAALARAEAGDLAAGLAELKAYRAETRIIDRLETASNSWIGAQRALAGVSLINSAVLAFAGPAAFLSGFALAAAGGTGAPVAALSGFVAFALFEAAAPLTQAAELHGKTAASARRLRELAEIAPPVRTPETPAAPPDRWDVRARNVTFSYPGAKMPALAGVDFDLPEGGRLALAGASGSGKSTIVKLLMRCYDRDSGELTLGGARLERLAPEDARRRFALVDQRAELLSATVAENLRLADPQADEPALWAALERARAAEFVHGLPEGLDTWIGEQGALVSGGQARRIALARAFVRNAPVLLLDEPTEGLDEATETEFLDALYEWLDADGRRSVLIVTHRAALIERAHSIVVLENGRVAEAGALGDLAGSGGVFDRLFPAFRRAS